MTEAIKKKDRVGLGAKTPEVKAVKAPKLKLWKALTTDVVRARLATSVHFSSKPVNTNAHASGVRLGSDEAIGLPLIGLVSTSTNRRVVDYQDGAVAGALLSQCASVVEGTVADNYKDVPAEQLVLVRDQTTILDQRAEVGTHTIDPRLRQVLFPTDTKTGYVSLTPLHSSVFSAHLRARLQAEIQRRADAGDPMRRTITQILVGGSKAQNVGRIALVGSMQRALVFGAPQESPELRAAYALFHKGVRISSLVNRKTLAELAAWRESKRNDDGILESTADLREQERQIIMRIGREAIVSLDKQREIVAPYVDELGGWASDELGEFERSLLDESVRSRTWAYEFAQCLLRVVEGYQTSKDARPLAGYGDVLDYLDMLKEAVK